MFSLTSKYSGLPERYQGQVCQIVKELTEPERLAFDRESEDVCYSYYCPMTEQRVASSKVFLVKWLDTALENDAESERSYFKFHKYLTVGQMLPHPRSWPDRSTICTLSERGPRSEGKVPP